MDFKNQKEKKGPPKNMGWKEKKQNNYIQELKVNFSTALLRWLCIQIPWCDLPVEHSQIGLNILK